MLLVRRPPRTRDLKELRGCACERCLALNTPGVHGPLTVLDQHLREALPIDILHGIEMDPLIAASRVDRHDMGMVELSSSLGLDQKPLPLTRVDRRGERQDLQGNPPAKRHLPRLIDDPHASSTQLTDDLIVPQSSTRGSHLLVMRRGWPGGQPGTELPAGGLNELESRETLGQFPGNRWVPVEEFLSDWRRVRIEGIKVLFEGRHHLRIRRGSSG